MKKFIKKLIPLLLVALIIASLVWYCFIFDRNFARDMLLAQARYFSTRGNQKISSWFYDTAYLHSGQDDSVAIELANQFKAEGNYTKAEYTLTNAIASSPSAELYIALCKTYVEQNKLMDAVNMLGNIQSYSIRNQLDVLRPAAPVADPEAGFYSQYILVGLSGSEGTIYYTTNGEYPSTDDIPYSEPFQISGGETVVQAISVADNGLVSPLTELTYTVGGVIEEVTFEDAAIEEAVRQLLGSAEDAPLYSNELWNITSFTVPENASDLDDLAKLPYLNSLTIEDRKIDSLVFLNSLDFLDTLSLTECKFSSSDISIIASIPTLKSLTLADCSLSTVAGLESALNLEYLDLSENTLRNLEPLTNLISLRTLNLRSNAVTNLSALSALVNLEKLDLGYNSIISLAPLATCGKLAWLDVSHNALSTLAAVDSLPELTHFSANHNGLTDVSILGMCTNLVELDISNNAISNISALASLSKLEMLSFARNSVTELPKFSQDCALRSIDGNYNQITSVNRLKNLAELSHVYLDYNQISDVSPLENCYKLVMVNVYGNTVTGVEKLTDRGIIVNYNPT